MSPLHALLLATPLFGFSLTPPGGVAPALLPPSAAHLASLPLPLLLEVDDASDDAAAIAAEAGEPPPTHAVELDEEDRRILEETIRRREIGDVHRALGISTFLSMTATVALGFIQFYDLYGFGASLDQTPCVTGTAIVQDQCYGTPWMHLAPALVTSALYVTTFSLSLAMPDPNHVSEGRGSLGERIRIHQALRWVHLVGMVAQTVMGIGLSNGWFGDRANDFETLQIVASVHQAVGWTTWAALGVAGAIMIF